MLFKLIAPLASPFLAVALLTGCAATPAAPTTSASPTASPSSTRGADAFAEFETIAGASCDKALAVGVIETMPNLENPEWVYIMVPKDQGIDGFSAAGYEIAKDQAGIFYETGFFESCYFGQFFSLAREGNANPAEALTVTYDSATDSYTATETVDDGTKKTSQSTQFFMNEAGLFARVKYLDTGTAGYETWIEYRAATTEERAILQKAVTAEKKPQSEQ